MMKHLVIAVAVWAVCLVALPAQADAFGHRRERVSCCPPPPPIPVVLQVCHPCTGCKYQIPVCIPACCVDQPCVYFERTLFGYGRTVFEWKNGHTVVVRYPHGGGYRVIERG